MFVDAATNIRFEKVVTETICLIAAPPSQITIETATEVTVSAHSTTPESVALYRERMEEVDDIIDVIAAVEEEYWGDIFAA